VIFEVGVFLKCSSYFAGIFRVGNFSPEIQFFFCETLSIYVKFYPFTICLSSSVHLAWAAWERIEFLWIHRSLNEILVDYTKKKNWKFFSPCIFIPYTLCNIALNLRQCKQNKWEASDTVIPSDLYRFKLLGPGPVTVGGIFNRQKCAPSAHQRKTLMVLLGLPGGWGCVINWHILPVSLVKPEILLWKKDWLA